MCIATPMKIEKIDGTMAHVCVGTVKSRASILLIPHAKKGDYVLVHAGIAIEKINRSKAEELLTLLSEIGHKMKKGF